MATLQEVMILINAKNNASGAIGEVNKELGSMGEAASKATTYFANGLNSIDTAAQGIFSKYSGGKSFSDVIFGTSSKAETNNVLLSTMSSTKEAADSLYSHVDDVTNSSLVSMQSLIPAMNGFKTATGATDDQIYKATEGIAQFGEKVLAQTGSTALAETAMYDLSKGIKGATASIDQYGITVDALKNTGLWDGSEEDIEGYMAAVVQLTGDTSALMQTNEGLDAQIGKMFSSAGKKIGNEFLPGIKDLKKAFIDLNSATGGQLAAGILVFGEGVEMASEMGRTVSEITNGVRDLKAGWDTVSSAVKGVIDTTKKAGNASEGAVDALGIGSDLSGLGDMKDKKKQMEKLEDAAEIVPEGIGAKATASGAEAATASAGFSGLSAAITTMLVPLLAISAVVAIMIPIITGLVAEALIFAKAIQELIVALDFGGVDMTKSIEGLKQLGSAMGEVMKTMAMMTFTAWLTIIYQVMTGLNMFKDPMQTCVETLKDAMVSVNQLGSVANVDESIPSKLQTLTQSLDAINKAMQAMGSTVLTTMLGNLMTLGGLLGDFKSNMQSAVEDLQTAIDLINNMNFQTVDEGKITQLKNACEALSSMGDAIGSIGDITWADAMNNLNVFSDVPSALESAHEDLKQATSIVAEFTDLDTVDESTATTIKNVCESLKSISQALGSIGDISWDATWGQIGNNYTAGLQSAHEILKSAADEINKFQDITDVTPVGNKLVPLIDALKPIKSAVESLSEFNGLTPPSQMIVTKISQTKDRLIALAEEINGMQQIADITAVGSKIIPIIDALKPISSAIDSLNEVNGKTIPPQTVITKVSQTKDRLIGVANEINGMQGIPDITGVGPKIIPIIDALKPIKSAIESMNEFNGLTVPPEQIVEKVRQAKERLMGVAEHIVDIQNIPNIEGVGPKIIPIIDALKPLKSAVQSMMNFPQTPEGVVEKVRKGVTTLKQIADELNKLQGTNVDNISGIISAVQDALNQLNTALANASINVVANARNIGTNIVNAIKFGMSPLPGVLTSAVSSATGSMVPPAIDGGRRAGTEMTNGFKFTLKLADVVKTEMGYVKTAVDNGISSAKTAAQNGAADIVAAFKSGIEVGSPGAMAWATYDEMNYINDFIKTQGRHIIHSTSKLSRDMVESFGTPQLKANLSGDWEQLRNMNGNVNATTLGRFHLMNSNTPTSTNNNRPVSISIGEGAIKLDARNLTTKESKQVMINALEGLDCIRNVDIRGI